MSLHEHDTLAPVVLEGVLGPSDLARYRLPGRVRLTCDLALAWLQIGAAFGLCALAPHPASYALALVLVVGGQHALGLASHECVHGLVAPRSRRVNDWLGRWLFAAPLGVPFDRLRTRHFLHHRRYGTAGDSERAYQRDLRGAGFRREVLRSLSGAEALEEQRALWRGPRALREEVLPLALVQVALCASLCAVDPWLYVGLWLLPLATLAPLLAKLRALAEHQPPAARDAAVSGAYFRATPGPFARTLRPRGLERFLLGRLCSGYHAEHHLFPDVSYQYLPRVHERLLERRAFEDPRLACGGTYWSALEALVRAEPPEFRRGPAPHVARCAVPRCPACRSAERRALFDARDHEYTTTTDQVFPTWECRACGAWYLDPRPDVSALDVILPPNYAEHLPAARVSGSWTEPLLAGLEQHRLELRLGWLARHCALGASTRWLDVGCGDGALLELVCTRTGARGTGLERDAASAGRARARGFAVHAARFEDWDPKGERFDLVHLGSAFAQVESPLALLERVAELVEPGGVVALAAPNPDAWTARRLGACWGGLHAPRHFAWLGARSLHALAQSVGLEHVETAFARDPRVWTRSLHALLLPCLGRDLCDWLLPCDHRALAPSVRKLCESVLLASFDALELRATGATASLLATFRRSNDA